MMNLHSNRRERGQVLLMGILALLILIFVLFLLFDVQNMFRAKVKLQTAVDAACITGANWQRHTLNTVGELNIIKAASILLEDDLFGIGRKTDGFLTPRNADEQKAMTTGEDSALNRIRTASDTLSQMQYRVLFILPLIGTGAAQQAAKNNGASSNDVFNTYVSEYVDRIDGRNAELDLYSKYKTDDFCSRKTYGFLWAEPYTELLRQILFQGTYGSSQASMTGFAVMPNSVILGQPDVKSDSTPDFSPWLGNKDFYENVRRGNLGPLIAFYDERIKCSSSRWWGDITSVLSDQDFICESELLPVGVRVKSVSEELYSGTNWNKIDMAELPEALQNFTPLPEKYDTEDPFLQKGNRKNPDDTDGRISILPALSWAVFKDSWMNYADDFTNEWNDYLIAPLKEEAKYASGAVSRMDAKLSLRSVTGYMGVRKQGTLPDLSRGLGNIRSGSSDLMRLKRAQEELRETAVDPTQNFALAKPFGSITFQGKNAKPPHVLEFVLPVFTRASLIPVSLEDPGESPLADWLWYEFLLLYIPKLGTVNSLDEMPEEYKTRFKQWHDILKTLDDPAYIEDLGVWINTLRYDYVNIYTDEEGNPIFNEDGTRYVPNNRDVYNFKIRPRNYHTKGGTTGSEYHQLSSGTSSRGGPLSKH